MLRITDLSATRKSEFLAIAEAIASAFPMPVNVSQICDALGILIRRERIQNAHALLVREQGVPVVVLPAGRSVSQSCYSPQERYLIAHEIAHHVLLVKGVEAPKGEPEYWQTERICDEFARTLLVQSALLGQIRSDVPGITQAWLEASTSAAHRAQVPWHVAASRISDVIESARFMGMKFDSSEAKVSFSTFRQRRGYGITFRPGDPIYEYVHELTIGSTVRIPTIYFDGVRLPGILEVAATLHGNGYAKFAMSISSPKGAFPETQRGDGIDALTMASHA